MANITSANAVFMLGITSLFPTPQQVQGFSTDAAFETDAIEAAEVMKGVDGFMSAGWVPTMNRMTVNLQADSSSGSLFDAWIQANKAARNIYFANGIITLVSTGNEYNLIQGVLTSYPPIPPARRVLQPRAFVITWSDISPVPV